MSKKFLDQDDLLFEEEYFGNRKMKWKGFKEDRKTARKMKSNHLEYV